MRSPFSTYTPLPGRGWDPPVSTLKEEHLNEKMSSQAGLEKKPFNPPQKYRPRPLLATQVHPQSRPIQRTGIIPKILGQSPGGGCQEHRVKPWAFYLHKGAGRGASGCASGLLPKSVIPTSWNPVGGHLLPAMLVPLLPSSPPNNKLPVASNMVDLHWPSANQRAKNCDPRRF